MPTYEDLHEEVTSFFSSRFGVVREALKDLSFVERGGGEIWATSAPTPTGIASSRPAGIRMLRRMPRGFKPTTAFLCFLGDRIVAARMEVEDIAILQQLLLGQPIDYTIDDGYVAISYRGDVLGCAAAKDGRVRALIPTQKRRELLGWLESERSFR